MKKIFCFQCDHQQVNQKECEKCAAPLKVRGYQLEARLDSPSSEVEASGKLFRASKEAQPFLVRVAPHGGEARLRREETILKGLNINGIPKVIESFNEHGYVFGIMSEGEKQTLQQAIAEGRRSDEESAKRFLRSALGILVKLESLSPPVHHRAISSSTLTIDQSARAGLIDFAQATDTLKDITDDLVVGDAFYAPDKAQNESARSLYGLALSALYLLSRQHPREILEEGQGLNKSIRVSSLFESYLEKLLDAQKGFKSATEALEAFPGEVHVTPRTRMPLSKPFVIAASLFVLLFTAAVGYWFSNNNRRPVDTIYVPSEPTPLKTPPEPKLKEGQAHLEITSTPKGATLFINGAKVGTSPYSAVVSKGMLKIRATYPGHSPDEIKVSVDGNLKVHTELDKINKKERTGKTRTLDETPSSPKFTSSNAKILRAIERAVRKQKTALLKCKGEVSRVKFHLELGGDGNARRLSALGAQTQAQTQCAKNVLSSKVRYPTPPGNRSISADVWVWFSPSFKVAAY